MQTYSNPELDCMQGRRRDTSSPARYASKRANDQTPCHSPSSTPGKPIQSSSPLAGRSSKQTLSKSSSSSTPVSCVAGVHSNAEKDVQAKGPAAATDVQSAATARSDQHRPTAAGTDKAAAQVELLSMPEVDQLAYFIAAGKLPFSSSKPVPAASTATAIRTPTIGSHPVPIATKVPRKSSMKWITMPTPASVSRMQQLCDAASQLQVDVPSTCHSSKHAGVRAPAVLPGSWECTAEYLIPSTSPHANASLYKPS